MHAHLREMLKGAVSKKREQPLFSFSGNPLNVHHTKYFPHLKTTNMKNNKRKLVLKKTTVKVLNHTEKLVFGGSRRACSVTACLGTDGCCQPTR
jgi:hypothetical protein